MRSSARKLYGSSCSGGAKRSGLLQHGGILALTAVMLAGCSSAGLKGRADPPTEIAASSRPSAYSSEIKQALNEAALVEAYFCRQRPWVCSVDVYDRRPKTADLVELRTEPDLQGLRNDYLHAMTRAYKLALEDYARKLTVEGGWFSFASHLAQLGLNVAAGISKVQETARVLNALAVGAIGVDERYDERVLLGNTIQVLLEKMRAAQSRQIAAILRRRNQSIGDYPLSEARADVIDLGAVVNIETAIAALAKEARDDRESAEAEVRETKACNSEVNQKIKAWLRNDDADEVKKRFSAIQNFLKTNNVNLSVAQFVADCRLADQQLALIGVLGIE